MTFPGFFLVYPQMNQLLLLLLLLLLLYIYIVLLYSWWFHAYAQNESIPGAKATLARNLLPYFLALREM